MTIELVGLAYDQNETDAIWSRVSARAAYDLILEDDFRRKVDFRSMLYHKGQLELLAELEHFLKRGGEESSLVELVAARFASGIEDLPNPSGEFALDFQLIRYFSSLAMADDYLVAESFLRALLRKVGFLKNGTTGWSLLETWDFDGIALALRDVRMQDILEAGRNVEVPQENLSFENLVRNYIEFLSYSRNNALTPFFFNSQSNFKRWGNLVERKNQRAELIVDLSLQSKKKKKETKKAQPKVATKGRRDIKERMKLRRESDALVGGLKDSDPLIRQKSAESLGRLKDPGTLLHLVEALVDPEAEVRQEIVRAIGAIPDTKANQVLLAVLAQDETFSVRLVAAYMLRKRREKGAIPILIDALEQQRPHMSAELAYHPMLPTHSAGVRRLTSLATSKLPEVRREVAFILGRLPTKSSADALCKMVEDSDDETRCNALYSLWDIGSSKAKTVSKKMSFDSSESVAQSGTIVSYWAQAKVA